MQAVAKIAPEPWMRGPETAALFDALGREGAVARFVGGAVRDAVAGRPVGDLDVATTGAPEDNQRLLAAAAIKVIPTGLAHGTLTAISGDLKFEVTTLRRDVETFGRRARVDFTDDWAADAGRRDFTMNALYADPDGTIYDPTGGRADIRNGRIRFIGNPGRRIEEDYLRILRFFRFHAWYGAGPANRAALSACRDRAAGIDGLSGERITQELFKLLAAPRPGPSLRLMARRRILERILPAGADLAGLARLHRVEAGALTVDPLLRLAALMRGSGGAATALADRLRFSNADRHRLEALLAPPFKLRSLAGAGAMRRAVYRHGKPLTVDLARLAGRARLAEAAAAFEAPRFPLRGRDAVALGISPGPEMGRLLARVEEWWVAGDFKAGKQACRHRLARAAAEES